MKNIWTSSAPYWIIQDKLLMYLALLFTSEIFINIITFCPLEYSLHSLHFPIMCLFTICPWFWSRDASYFPMLCIVIVLSQKSFLLIHIVLVHCGNTCWAFAGWNMAFPWKLCFYKWNSQSIDINYTWESKCILTYTSSNYHGGTAHKWSFMCMQTLKCFELSVTHISIFKLILNLKLNENAI